MADVLDRLSDRGLLKDRCLVNGQWVGDPADPVLDPATGARLGRVPRLGAGETATAVEAARAALVDWSARTAKDRSVVLRRWFDLVMAAQDDLALIMTSEQGKPLSEARGEIAYAAAFIEYYAEEAKRVSGEILASHRTDARILVLRQPIGVVAAITPWNFPAAMITRKAAPALAAGCTMVVKPAGETPLTALALGELAVRAGLPAGVLNIVTGEAAAIGGVMTSHEAVRMVSFTGSTAVGKLLARQGADTVKRMALELGGDAPFIVFDDADLDAAVEGAMVAKYRNSGQTCVCANRIYVQAGVHDAFIERLAAKVAALKVGDGREADVVQGPLIDEKAVAKVERLLGEAVGKGARVVVGGGRHALGGTFFQPTVLSDVMPDMAIMGEEIFGPVAPVTRFENEAEVLALANASRNGLAAYLYSRDLGRVFRVAEGLETGMVGINTGLVSTELAPFGGIKESGLGREGSRHGLEEYTELKYLLLAGLG